MKRINKFAIAFLIGFISITSFSQTDFCLDFDGTDDYVFIGDFNDLGTSNFTIEAWIYIEGTNGPGNKIINKGLTSVGTPLNAGYSLRANYHGADEIEFNVGHSDGSTIRVIYNGISTNKWYHVAGVRNGQELELYLNGVLVASDQSHTIFNVDTDIPLVIGAIHKDYLSPINEFMDGKIDEVRIWNRARTPYEIDLHKDCAITTPNPNLVAVYNFNEYYGHTAADSSGNDNHGMVENGPVWTSSPVAPICYAGLNETIEKGYVNIYPNPFQSVIFVDEELNICNFKVYDMTGRLVKKDIINHNKINMERLISGCYVLEISIGNKIMRNKIIKE